MLSVLIADDEWIERDGISLLLRESPWEFQIYMAENGEEAADILKKHEIDILFTDIKMPFMDGLELLVVANQSCKGLKVVIFSAFADFTYAKTALENRVFHYFLKPVDPEEFEEVLAELVTLIFEEREKGKRIQRWVGGSGGELQKFLREKGRAPKELISLFDEEITYRLWMVNLEYEKETAIARFYEKIKSENGNFVYQAEISEEIFLLMSQGKENKEKEVRDILEDCDIRRACVILSGKIQGEKAFVESYLRMEGMLGFHFYSEENQLFHVGEAQGDREKPEMVIDLILKEINYGVENDNFQYVLESLAILREEMREHIGNSHIYVKYLYANILKKLMENRDISGVDFKTSLERLFHESSLSGVHEMMMGIVNHLMEDSNEEGREKMEQKRVIRKVLSIIEERYQEDLGLQSIAEEVYLTPLPNTGNIRGKRMKLYKKIVAKIRDAKFANKLFAAFFLTSSITLIPLGIYSYHQAHANLFYQERQSVGEQIWQENFMLNSQIARYQTVISSLINNSQIQQCLNTEDVSYFQQYLMFANILEPTIENILAAHTDVLPVKIYTDNETLKGHSKYLYALEEMPGFEPIDKVVLTYQIDADKMTATVQYPETGNGMTHILYVEFRIANIMSLLMENKRELLILNKEDEVIFFSDGVEVLCVQEKKKLPGLAGIYLLSTEQL